MKQVFEIKLYESQSTHLNITKVINVCYVADDLEQVLHRCTTPYTITVEVVSVKPCLIL